jgi:hypothetical protein
MNVRCNDLTLRFPLTEKDRRQLACFLFGIHRVLRRDISRSIGETPPFEALQCAFSAFNVIATKRLTW